MQSLILRAEHLGIITSARSRSLHAYMNKLGYLPVEPLPLDREEPSVLTNIVDVHLNAHEYTTSELANVLGMPTKNMVDQFTDRSARRLRAVR